MSNKDFDQQVLEIVKNIPAGRITTYKEIAIVLGNERLSRAVGQALKRNPYPIKIPCHRVIHSDGTLGGYSLGIKRKKELLEREGIKIIDNRVLDSERIILRSDKLRA